MQSTRCQIEAIFLMSTDPEGLAHFYSKAFELGHPVDQGEGQWGVSIGDVYFGFEQFEGSPRSGPGRTTVWLRVEDVFGVFHRLVSLGATAVMSPIESDPDEVIATVLDPDGNLLGVIGPALQDPD